jgi:hypothetical protein
VDRVASGSPCLRGSRARSNSPQAGERPLKPSGQRSSERADPAPPARHDSPSNAAGRPPSDGLSIRTAAAPGAVECPGLGYLVANIDPRPAPRVVRYPFAPREMLPRALFQLLIIVLMAPGVASGQGTPGTGSDHEVGAAVSVRAGATWIGGRSIPIAGISGTLRLSPQFELGGEGVLTLGTARVSPGDSADRSEIRMGYGGLLVRWRPAGGLPGVRWGGSFLLGSGAARIRSPLVDADIAARSYFFIEPSVHLLLLQDRIVRISLDGGYRVTFGPDALPGVSGEEFRAPVLSLGLQWIRDP